MFLADGNSCFVCFEYCFKFDFNILLIQNINQFWERVQYIVKRIIFQKQQFQEKVILAYS